MNSFLASFFFLIPFIRAPVTEMGYPGVNWEERAPESQGINSVKLNHAVSYLASQCGEHKTDQMLVTCNGYMVWKGNDIDLKHNVWSCSKSFTSTVLGLLIDDQKCELHTKASDYLPSLKMHYPELTLAHFTTMTSGYDAVGGAQTNSPFQPKLPLFSPGTMFKYHDCAMNQFAQVLTHIAAEPLEQLFQRKIAEPIGMDTAYWDWHDWGIMDGLLVNGGAGNKSRGIFISASELARLGHLYLNRGHWEGMQLLSSAWVDMAITTQVEQSLPAFDSLNKKGPGTYGFNWWVNGVGSEGSRKWPSAPQDTYAAMGHNNNVCFVIPEWNMVIVRLGVDGNIPDSSWDMFLKMVSEAIN